MFATPAPLSTVLWRVVVLQGDTVQEGFYSLFDKDKRIAFDAFPRGQALAASLAGNTSVQRMTAFTDGFVALREKGNTATLTDLRMGQEPNYVFSFEVARRDGPAANWIEIKPESAGNRGDAGAALRWLWPRMWGEQIAPPR
ncbi:MAG: hypothetical protein WEK74_13575 [Hydrogenophaga sp.]